jgi:hypothetical protein
MKLISKTGFGFFCDDNFIFFIGRDEKNQDKFFKTDLDNLSEISKEEYMKIKFGKTWLKVESAYTECIQLDNSEYLTCIFRDSAINHHDMDGNKIKEYDIGHFGTGFDITYSIALDKNENLWIAQPMSHYVGQFALETENELFKIGGDYENPDIFNYPEQVRVFGDFAFVCDMGNHRICKINIDTKEVTEYKKYGEPIWEFGQFRDKEIIKLSSGLYEL